MFYGVPPDKLQEFRRALDTLAAVYPGKVYANDMLITIGRNLSFRSDERFMESFRSSAQSDQEQSLLWRLHVLTWAARNALHVDGDFAECGVLKGFSSEVICKYLGFQDLPRRYYLYDTFSGLPEETSTETERKKWQSYKEIDGEALYREVCEKFSVYGNVEVVRGVVPDSFGVAVPEKIAFLHIDMNSERAEMLALEHLFDRVVPGGVIVLDDFGWTSHVGQTKAELAFMRERGHAILELPTGQGMILKHA